VELLPQSAWSCCHGVGRWFEDCGCSAGGGPGWSQAWRAPLRQGLDQLRDALATIFQDEGAALFRDPWAARDDYIELVLDGGQAARAAFFDRHQVRAWDPAERGRALRLLEMQHQAMLMFTSCGWFFADISGIETVQNLRYAARAIELAAPFAPMDLEAMLLQHLARARSNVEAHKNGRHLWERQVRPSRVGPEEAVARLLVDGALGRAVRPAVRYRWALVPDPIAKDQDLVAAGVAATSVVTGETLRFAAACRRDGPFEFLAGVAPWPAAADWSVFLEEAKASLHPRGARLAAWSGRYAARLLRLRDLLVDERHAVLKEFLTGTDAWLAACRARLCDEALPATDAMVAAGMGLPKWLGGMLEAHWTGRFVDGLAKLQDVSDPAAYADLLDLSQRARRLGLRLDLSAASAHFGRILSDRLDAIAGLEDADPWQTLLELLQLASRLGLRPPEYPLQDRMFALLRTAIPQLVSRLADARDPRYRTVSAMLAVAARVNLRTEEIRARLGALEAPVAADPTYWP
jgi:hypothetical protein